MFIYALGCLALFLALFFLSRRLYQQVFLFFYRLIRHRNTAIRLLVIFFLPGTIIHELAHFLAATFLGVRTGTINLLPKIHDDGQVVAGETQIAVCDPIRYSLIGVAPFLVGVILIYSINRFFLFETVNFLYKWWPGVSVLSTIFNGPTGLRILAWLVIFWASNTMFSSAKDLQAIAVPLVLLYILGFVAYFSGLKVSLSAQLFNGMTIFWRELSFYLLLALALNLAVWLAFELLNRIVRAVGRRTIG